MSFDFTSTPAPTPAPMPLPTPTPAAASEATSDRPSSGWLSEVADFVAKPRVDGTTDYLGGLIDFGPPGSDGCGSDHSGWIVPDKMIWNDFYPACGKHDESWGKDRSYEGMLAANRRLSDDMAAAGRDGYLPNRLFTDFAGEFYELVLDGVTINEHAAGPVDFAWKAAGQILEDGADFALRVVGDVGESVRRSAEDLRGLID